MHLIEELDIRSITRLGKQYRLLLRMHNGNLSKDPLSHATESSRSNLMAAQHTVKEMYGEDVARDIASLTPIA